MSWSIVLTKEAETEFRILPEDMRGRFLYIGTLLTNKGPAGVGMPHVRPIGGKLWEIRMTGRDGIARAFYFAASARRLIVVRIFVKKTDRTPRQEIALARKRMEALGE